MNATEKIRKLLELARRGIGGEADNARAAAEKMAKRHCIDLTKIALTTPEQAALNTLTIQLKHSRLRYSDKLAVQLCVQHFDGLRVRDVKGGGKVKLVFCVPKPNDPAPAAACFRVAAEEIQRAWTDWAMFTRTARQAIHPRNRRGPAHKESFMSGMFQGMNALIERDKIVRELSVNERNGGALVTRQAVEKRLKEKLCQRENASDAQPGPLAVAIFLRRVKDKRESAPPQQPPSMEDYRAGFKVGTMTKVI